MIKGDSKVLKARQFRGACATLIAGGLVAGLAAVPALGAFAFDGAIETRCSDTNKKYDNTSRSDSYQYGEFQLCAGKTDSTINYQIYVKDLYFFAMSWITNDHGGWKVRPFVEVDLYRDGVLVDGGKRIEKTSFYSASATFSGSFVASAPGIYKVVANVVITGMRWQDPDYNVSSGPLSRTLVVG